MVTLGLVVLLVATMLTIGTALTAEGFTAYHARGDLALGVSLQGALAVLGLLAVPTWSLAAGQPSGAAGRRRSRE
ncbi:hypothetical protein OHA25_13425 [Nonomuraea sp. NBC_00507]|uniref:hypothetical protein n=1 Tax=Nonomuraea sp. NBC_00507 TaxID=2976002 RepID=UPI002E172B0E